MHEALCSSYIVKRENGNTGAGREKEVRSGAGWLVPMSVLGASGSSSEKDQSWCLWSNPRTLSPQPPGQPPTTAAREWEWAASYNCNQATGRTEGSVSFPHSEQVILPSSRNYKNVSTCPLIQEHLMLLLGGSWRKPLFHHDQTWPQRYSDALTTSSTTMEIS